jgi:hypothetical protein
MAFIKHVGRMGDRKLCVLFRQVPGEDHMCLIIHPEVLPAHWQDAIQKVIESDIGQTADELANAMHRSLLPDGRPILETLHNERMIKKVRTADVIMTPTTNSSIRLDELNKMLNEMKQGDEAIKRMAQNDASRGMVEPGVKRAAEAAYKKDRAEKADPNYVAPPVLKAGQDGALTDRDIAANMLAQAKAMELNAKQMVAEAARMKKDAERMDPTVNAKNAKKAPPVAVAETAPVPKARRAKAKVADATAQ